MDLLALALTLPLFSGDDGGLRPPFEDQRRPAPLEVGASDLAFVDLDGDGDLDAVIVSLLEVVILANDGEGRFEEPELIPLTLPPGSLAYRVASGDLDGDGDQDLFLDDTPYFNDGAGRLAAGPTPIPQTTPGGLVLADLDGDADLDVAMINARQSSLLLGDGAGGFVDASSQLPFVGGSNTDPLIATDVDLDGDLDLISGRRLLRNDGSAAFVQDPKSVPVSAAFGMLPADADGDGYTDLFVIDPARRLRLLRNDGGLRFVSQATLADPGPEGFSVADFDEDGDVDVLSVHPPLLLLNDGTGNYVDASAGLPASVSLPMVFGQVAAIQAAADVDGDGDVDVLAQASGPKQFPLRLWLNDGRSAFLEAQQHVPVEDFKPLALVDVDGDGDLDVVGELAGAPGSAVRLNDGAGVLRPAPGAFGAIPPAQRAAGIRGVAVGDVDGDGDPDLLWAQGQECRLNLNAGDQGFIDATHRLPVRNQVPQAVALADFDGDGDLDAFVADTDPFLALTNGFWRNDGAGNFADESGVLPPRTEGTFSLAIGDVDGDGHLDVFLGNEDQDGLFLGDGAGGFTDGTAQVPLRSGNRRTTAVALADLDGDGDLDVYTGNASVSTIGGYEGGLGPAADELLLNDGAGGFVVDPSHASASHLGKRLLAADFDEDGDVDVLVGAPQLRTRIAYFGGDTRYYANQGGGTLSLAPRSMGFDDSEMVAGDLDGDGDLDVVQHGRVLTNIQRSLAWSTLPRAGRVLKLALHGPASSPYFLVAATRRANIVADFGTVFVDPSAGILAVPGRLSPAGGAGLAFAVPAELLGETLYWQALVDTPARTTNLEATTFRGY